MTKTEQKLHIEHAAIFVLCPLSLAIPLPTMLKAIILGLVGLHVIRVTVDNHRNIFKTHIIKKTDKPTFFKAMAIKAAIIFFATLTYLYMVSPDQIFIIFKEKSIFFWLMFVGIYVFFSVLPQEFLFRTFYFYRYRKIFKHPTTFILVNTLVFSFAHIFYYNVLVLGITAIGGLIFTLSYKKHKSFWLLAIEHGVYGSILFTAGLGKIFGFPV